MCLLVQKFRSLFNFLFVPADGRAFPFISIIKRRIMYIMYSYVLRSGWVGRCEIKKKGKE